MLKALPGYSARGAQMGRLCYGLPQQLGSPIKLYLQRVRFVDGDYDAGGAYWGGRPSLPLFCAFDTENKVRWFVRATTRSSAKLMVRKAFRKATFYR